MTTPDYRALCAELAGCLDDALAFTVQGDTERSMRQLITRARTLLAAPEAVGVADEDRNDPSWHELWDFVHIEHGIETRPQDVVAVVRAALTRYGTAHLAPVPVGERLPGKEDCTEYGEVWVIESGYSYALGDTGGYDWEPHRIVLRSIGEFDARYGRTWLPHWALPLPEAQP